MAAVMPLSYRASLSTGVFGSYTVQFQPAYKPSYSSGVYGSYTVGYTKARPAPVQRSYAYLPSVSSGIFGTWLYNTTSPTVASIPTPSPRALLFARSAKLGDFQIRGPRSMAIAQGTKYGVKLLQEFVLPTGKHMANQRPSGSGKLFICQGSVVSFSGEAIINAANTGMLGGGGVDGAISSAGGDALYDLRYAEPTLPGTRNARCRTGDAKITQSGFPHNRLQCDYVIHAVGPNYSVLSRGGAQLSLTQIDQLLYDSYANSMKRCAEFEIRSVGFCLISSGIFRGPRSLDEVLKLGLMAIRDCMFAGIEVFVIGYTCEEMACLRRLAPQVLGAVVKEYAAPPQKSGWSMGEAKAMLRAKKGSSKWLSDLSSGLGGLANKLKGGGKNKGKDAKGKGGGK